MQDARLYPRYRFVMGTLDILCSSLTHMVCLAIAPMLNFIAADLGVDAATAGYATTLHILMQGVFMLCGPMIVSVLDHKKTQLAGVSVMVVGSVLSYFAPGFGMLLAARILTGVGHGLSSACTHSIIAAWFPPKEKSAMVTANRLGIVAITTLTYTCTVPVYRALGSSWRLVLLLMGGVLLVLDIAWALFARNNDALNAYIREQNAQTGKKVNAFSSMREALSRKDVMQLGVFMGLTTIAANGISTYLPQFLENVRSYTAVEASAIVGVASGVSALATLAGGVATTAIGKRKAIIVPFYALSIVFLTLSLLVGQAALISALFILYTVCSNLYAPASQTISTELRDVTPALTSSSASISFGIGFIGTFFTSPLLKFSTQAFGEEYSMLVYVPLFIIALIFSMLLPETGPGRKSADAK